MQTTGTNTFLHQFNDTIDKWIGFLDDYTITMLCRRPNNQSWSLGQVYLHIIADTSFYIDQMKAALSTGANSEKGMHQAAKTMFDNDAFPDMRLENPANSLDLRQPLSKEELLQRLADIKGEVNRLWFTFDVEGATGKTEHPGLYFFSALEWLRFAGMHMRHHLSQKKRIDETLFGLS